MSALHVSVDVFAHHQEQLSVFTVSVASDYENNQQDALYRIIYFSKSAVHVSVDVFTHH
jgi:hypothetical protein